MQNCQREFLEKVDQISDLDRRPKTKINHKPFLDMIQYQTTHKEPKKPSRTCKLGCCWPQI